MKYYRISFRGFIISIALIELILFALNIAVVNFIRQARQARHSREYLEEYQQGSDRSCELDDGADDECPDMYSMTCGAEHLLNR